MPPTRRATAARGSRLAPETSVTSVYSEDFEPAGRSGSVAEEILGGMEDSGALHGGASSAVMEEDFMAVGAEASVAEETGAASAVEDEEDGEERYDGDMTVSILQYSGVREGGTAASGRYSRQASQALQHSSSIGEEDEEEEEEGGRGARGGRSGSVMEEEAEEEGEEEGYSDEEFEEERYSMEDEEEEEQEVEEEDDAAGVSAAGHASRLGTVSLIHAAKRHLFLAFLFSSLLISLQVLLGAMPHDLTLQPSLVTELPPASLPACMPPTFLCPLGRGVVAHALMSSAAEVPLG